MTGYWTERVEPAGPTVAAIAFLWTLLGGVAPYTLWLLL